jgi:hypothetical protein
MCIQYGRGTLFRLASWKTYKLRSFDTADNISLLLKMPDKIIMLQIVLNLMICDTVLLIIKGTGCMKNILYVHREKTIIYLKGAT